ncbi:MAG TPA: hypothetical protein VF163_19360 [Micromonosporaceae bacterium]
MVEFTGTGAAPSVCSSRPSSAEFGIGVDDDLVLVNLTGAEAMVTSDGVDQFRLSNGGAASVRLAAGIHSLSLVPQCAAIAKVTPVRVTVTGSESGAGPTSTRRPAPQPNGTATVRPVTGGSGSAGTADLAGGPSVTSMSAAPSGDLIQGLGGGSPGAIIDARGVAGTGSERQSRWLLATIAAIFLFGVAIAVIRAILPERVSGATRS